MNNLKYYNEYLNEQKIPDLKLDISKVLSPLEGNKIDLYTTFGIDPDKLNISDNIGDLFDDGNFNTNLKKNKLKKGKIEDTKFSETFISDNYILRFFFVYEKASIVLEEPKYIILQYTEKKNDKMSDIMVFLNKDNTIGFYEMLTDASIELTKGKKTYVYNTHNSGNNWELMNTDMVKGKFKASLDYDEMEDLLSDKKIKVQ